ncbi:hypothetical protein V5799_016400 [Amblyomma americanum]|uniref:Beta-galactosidase n=1 Tax=Amblyomma americanum TaxID=6943 RepID=A0AAQ4F6B9_AMBAM
MGILWRIVGVFSACVYVSFGDENRSFVIDHENKQFLKDGEPFRFVAGEMHYFRVPRAYWKDRLHKIKMAGLNAVSFYVEWSGHEPEPGTYNFQDMYDLDEFLKEVKEQDLLAIVRPGPYICAERDNGGLPYWLLREHPAMKYRTRDWFFLHDMDRWLSKLGPVLRPHTYENDGPIVMVQLEHQYGYYGNCDPLYLEHLLTMLEVRLGRKLVFFRGGPVVKAQYDCGKVRDALVTGYMTPTEDPAVLAPIIQSAQVSPGPLFISEYYTGGMDYWGWEHTWRPRKTVMKTFKTLMEMNASVTFYMFHGGTNFGFTAGSSLKHPLVTSYDYEAPISEFGDPTPMYYDIRNVTSKYRPLPEGEPPGPSDKMSVGPVELDRYASLEEVMAHFRQKDWLKRMESADPVTFEKFGQPFGFLLYRTTVRYATAATAWLQFFGLSDRAYVYGNGRAFVFYSFAVSWKVAKTGDVVPASKNKSLVILVENMGREAYTKTFTDPKGFKSATLNHVPLKNWTIEGVPLATAEDIDRIRQELENNKNGTVPGFFEGTFQLPEGQEPRDTFLDPRNWTKGVAFVNGINLGRYWPGTGPQVTLYVPAPFLKAYPQENSIMLFEVEGAPAVGSRTVEFVDKSFLNISILYPKP